MKKHLLTKTKLYAALFALSIAGCITVGCTEDIDQSNRYTFTGETITDYLENRPEQFRNFCKILDVASIGKNSSGSILKTLTTYGSYTCFAPTNEAVERYLFEMDSLYWATLAAYERGEIEFSDVEDNGIYSPNLEDLSKEAATQIAMNHIIEAAYFTTDIKSDGAFPKNNINNRFTSVSFANDEEGNAIILINNNAKIIESDIELENGIIHTVNRVVAPSNRLLCDHFAQYDSVGVFSIHAEAIKRTGIDTLLRIYELDPEYDKFKTAPTAMSTTGMRGTLAPYPETYLQKYTLLAVPDIIYKEKHGIDNIDELIAEAKRLYSHCPETATVADDDYTNPNHPLYKFISYHIIDRQLLYSGNGPGGFVMSGYVATEAAEGYKSDENLPERYDRYDYFETLYPYSIIKVTRPKSGTPLAGELIINYAQDDGTRIKNSAMRPYINARILPISEVPALIGIDNFTDNALNGSIHVIDRMLIYNEDEMGGNILNERMRWDSSSLFPELTNNGVRWHERGAGFKEIYIPDGFCKRLKINNETTYPFYLPPHPVLATGWSNYQGDEILVDGQYDFSYRIPHVPEGTYELRFGFGFSDARGVCQFYLDDKITGIPVEMRQINGKTAIGNISEYTDKALGDEETIDEFDKSLRNRGWMKGPGSVWTNGENSVSLRDVPYAYRRIITMTTLTKGDHWLRFKDVTKDGTSNYKQFSQDYLEIVPKTVISDPTKPEDKL